MGGSQAAETTRLDLVFGWVGIALIGVLALMGAVALVRDCREERVDRARLAEIIRQAKDSIADERNARHEHHG